VTDRILIAMMVLVVLRVLNIILLPTTLTEQNVPFVC